MSMSCASHGRTLYNHVTLICSASASAVAFWHHQALLLPRLQAQVLADWRHGRFEPVPPGWGAVGIRRRAGAGELNTYAI
jgi:hypothetical protein